MNFEAEKLTFRQKRILKSYNRRVLVDSLEIGLASPEQIRKWSRRILPNKVLSGEVLTPKTVDYKTLKPIKNGLFCEKIFGPTRDFFCSCGKKRINKSFCSECDVEHTEASVRRYRLGHINLISPVTHVWYLRGRPSYISTLLGKKRRSIEALAYCTTFLPEFIPPKNTNSFREEKTKDKTTYLNSKVKESIYGDLSQGKEIVFQARWDQRPENSLKAFSLLSPRFRVRKPISTSSEKGEEGVGMHLEESGNGLEGLWRKARSENGREKEDSLLNGKLGFFSPSKLGEPNEIGTHARFYSPTVSLISGGRTKKKEKIEKLSEQSWRPYSFSSGDIKNFKNQEENLSIENTKQRNITKNILSGYRKTFLFGEQGFQETKKNIFQRLTGKNKKASFLEYFYIISRNGKKGSSKIYERIPMEQNLKKKPSFQGRSPSRFCSINPISNKNIQHPIKGYKTPKNNYEEYLQGTRFLRKRIKKTLVDVDSTSQEASQRISKNLNSFKSFSISSFAGGAVPSGKSLQDFPFPLRWQFYSPTIFLSPGGKKIGKTEMNGAGEVKIKEFPPISNFDDLAKKLKMGDGMERKNKKIIFTKDFFSQSQTLPISPTFACDLDERSRFLDYITCISGFQDRKISIYSGMERKFSLEGVYELNEANLLNGEDGIEEILSYTGGEAIREMINRLDMPKLRRFLHFEIESLSLEILNLRQSFDPVPSPFLLNRKNQRYVYNKAVTVSVEPLLAKIIKRRARHWRRLKLAQIFSKSCKRPEWMILSALPVLPPDLRPILRLDGDVLVVSDLNQLYQKVLFRNSRFKRLGIITVESVAYAKGLLQEAVDALLDNGKGGAVPMVAPNDRPLKSLSDILKGKRGRFRQNLLGKRVDYSGRSVIVVGPKLLLHQCGLPREMALELFQPFIIRKLLTQGFAKGIGIAKKMIQENNPIVWEILSQLIRQHPLLLNRAPTLHRLGIQAFQPLLVPGRAILLHPLVCTAFNADFDGDQMAVHIPLSAQARAESWKLLWSRNNILSPATGQPVLLPSQDMVLGCYYLTSYVSKINDKQHFFEHTNKRKKWFGNMEEVRSYYDQGLVSIHQKIWMRVEGDYENGNNPERPIEFQVQYSGFWRKIAPKSQLHIDSNGQIVTTLIQTTPGRVLINEILQIKKSI